MPDPTSAQRFAPIALWRVASRLLVTLFNIFGEPQRLAFLHTVIARDYKLICNWLRTVEAVFRQLLLIEASHYARNAAPPKRYAKHKWLRREMTFSDEHPDAWRVSFRIFDGKRPRGHCAKRLKAVGELDRASDLAPTTFHSAWPLAERFEALLRVHNDPAPYAKRLARRLYATPERVACVINEPPELKRRIDPEPYAQIAALIGTRSPVFTRHPDSS